MPVTAIISILLVLFAGGVRSGELPPGLQGLGLRESPQASRELPGWKPPTRVVVSTLLGPEPVALLAAVSPGLEVVPAANVAAEIAAIPGAQVLVGFCNHIELAKHNCRA